MNGPRAPSCVECDCPLAWSPWRLRWRGYAKGMPARPATPSHDGDPPRARRATGQPGQTAPGAAGAGPGPPKKATMKRDVRLGAAPSAHRVPVLPARRAGTSHPVGTFHHAAPQLGGGGAVPAQRRKPVVVPPAAPAKIQVPSALREFFGSRTDLSSSASGSPQRSFTRVDAAPRSLHAAPAPLAGPAAPASPATLGSALRRASVSAPGLSKQTVRQLSLILGCKVAGPTLPEAREAAGAGEDGYRPLDAPEALLPLAPAPRGVSQPRPRALHLLSRPSPKRLASPRQVPTAC